MQRDKDGSRLNLLAEVAFSSNKLFSSSSSRILSRATSSLEGTSSAESCAPCRRAFPFRTLTPAITKSVETWHSMATSAARACVQMPPAPLPRSWACDTGQGVTSGVFQTCCLVSRLGFGGGSRTVSFRSSPAASEHVAIHIGHSNYSVDGRKPGDAASLQDWRWRRRVHDYQKHSAAPLCGTLWVLCTVQASQQQM